MIDFMKQLPARAAGFTGDVDSQVELQLLLGGVLITALIVTLWYITRGRRK